jgi:hypothetical protein
LGLDDEDLGPGSDEPAGDHFTETEVSGEIIDK